MLATCFWNKRTLEQTSVAIRVVVCRLGCDASIVLAGAKKIDAHADGFGNPQYWIRSTRAENPELERGGGRTAAGCGFVGGGWS